MSAVKICSQQEIDNNVAAACATKTKFGVVDVMVKERLQDANGTWTLRFSLIGDELGRDFKAQWGNTAEMWAACPSTLSATAKPGAWGAAPPKDTRGRLYLSATFLRDNKIVAEPKWPPLLPVTRAVTGELAIYPFKLELTGMEMRSGYYEQATIDLLDPSLAGTRQRLDLDGSSPVKVHLTRTAFSKFGLSFSPSSKAIHEALAVLGAKEGRTPQALAGAWSVIAEAAAVLAEGGEFDADLSQAARGQLEKLLSQGLSL